MVERLDAIRALGAAQKVPTRVVDSLVDALLRGGLPPGVESLAPLLQPELETVLDFVPADALIVTEEPALGRERLERHAAEGLHDFQAALGERAVCGPEELLVGAPEIAAALEQRRSRSSAWSSRRRGHRSPYVPRATRNW